MAAVKYLLVMAMIMLGACATTLDERQMTTDNTGMERRTTGGTMMDQITSEEMFIAKMIPHHQEAIEASQVMLDSDDPQVRSLAQQIIDDQTREVALLQGWLDAWYPGTRPAAMRRMMPDLEGLEGPERDRAYLEGMREHHTGAIDMAEQAISVDLRPEVRGFADDVVRKQSAEIREIDAMLQE